MGASLGLQLRALQFLQEGRIASVCSQVCLQAYLLASKPITGVCIPPVLAPCLQHPRSLEQGNLAGLLVWAFDLLANAHSALASCVTKDGQAMFSVSLISTV